jgi:hypothetical protein
MNFSDVCADLRKLLFPAQETRSNTNQTDSTATFDCVPWSWLVKNVVLLLEKYPSGLTKPVILSELQQMWDEVSIEWQRGTSRKSQTINSIYDTLTLQTDAILELWITSVKQLPGTKTTWIATLSDRVSEHQIAWYIHRRFFPLITNSSPLFKPGRLLRMTNCKLFDTSLSVDGNDTHTPNVSMPHILKRFFVIIQTSKLFCMNTHRVVNVTDRTSRHYFGVARNVSSSHRHLSKNASRCH